MPRDWKTVETNIRKDLRGIYWVTMRDASAHSRDYKAGTRLAEARALRAELLASRSRVKAGFSPRVTARAIMFKDFVAEYWEKRRLYLAENTISGYESDLRKYLIPQFGSLLLAQIDRDAVVRFYNNLHEQGLAYATRQGIKATLQAVLSEAVACGYLQVNPVQRIPIPGGKERRLTRPHNILTLDQLYTLVACAPAIHRALLLTLGLTGIRPGEAYALLPADIDFAANTITIEKTINHKGQEEVGTKTYRSSRNIQAPPELLGELEIHLTRRPREARYLFCTPSGAVIRTANTKRWWPDTREKAGLAHPDGNPNRPLRLYDLRHTYASLMAHTGADISWLSRQLGHESTKMTLDTYIHLYPDHGAEALQGLSRAIQKARKATSMLEIGGNGAKAKGGVEGKQCGQCR